MSIARFALMIAVLATAAVIVGCGNPSTPPKPLSPEAKARIDATSNAVRDAVIRQNIQNSFSSPSVDYGAGIKY